MASLLVFHLLEWNLGHMALWGWVSQVFSYPRCAPLSPKAFSRCLSAFQGSCQVLQGQSAASPAAYTSELSEASEASAISERRAKGVAFQLEEEVAQVKPPMPRTPSRANAPRQKGPFGATEHVEAARFVGLPCDFELFFSTFFPRFWAEIRRRGPVS